MNRTLSRLLCLATLLAGGCVTRPLDSPQYDTAAVETRLDPAPPAPLATEGVASSEVVPDPVQIRPETAVGYSDLPTTATELYDQPPLELSLREVVLHTLAHNRAIRIQGYTFNIASYEVPVSRGIYDLLLQAQAQYQKVEEQTSTAGFGRLAKNEARSRSGSVSLRQLLPTGAYVTAAYDVIYSSTQFLNFISLAPPISQVGVDSNYQHVGTLSIVQPLLQGFGPAITNAGIMIAQHERAGAAADFEARLHDTLTQTLETYWRLIGAIEIYKVRLINYAAARDLLRINTAKFNAGVLAQTDVLQAEAASETRREQLIVARQTVRDLEDQLKRLILLEEGAPLWEAQILPSQPFVWREIEADLEQTIALAAEERPELRRARSNIDQSEVNLSVVRNRVLPQLDLFASGSVNGLGEGFDEGGQNLRDGEYTGYAAGLQFSYPLQNRAARYRWRQAETSRDRASEVYADVSDQVVLEVRQALRALRTARERIDVTQSAVRSQAATLDSERKRYDVGISTAFEVLRIQEDLANAQATHLQAVIDYNIAAIELERARGTLLRTYGVSVLQPDLRPPVEPVSFPVGLN